MARELDRLLEDPDQDMLVGDDITASPPFESSANHTFCMPHQIGRIVYAGFSALKLPMGRLRKTVNIPTFQVNGKEIEACESSQQPVDTPDNDDDKELTEDEDEQIESDNEDLEAVRVARQEARRSGRTRPRLDSVANSVRKVSTKVLSGHSKGIY